MMEVILPPVMKMVVTGGIENLSEDNYDYEGLMMAKFNTFGDLLWSKNMATGEFSESYGNTAIEDKDGGYIFGGSLDTYDEDFNYDTSYAYAVKTNSSGDLLWTKTFESDTSGYTEFFNLKLTSDGGYIACGFAYLPERENSNGSILYKLNSNFETCNEVAGHRGITQNVGTNKTETISVENLEINSFTPDVVLTNIGDVEYVCSSNALPLQLLSFNATLQNKSVSVNWTTANEINTNYFVVERSRDAIAFTALQQVTAKGNSAGEQTYNTTDLQPLPGTSYYRLKEVDKDGKTTYSSVVPVTVLGSGVIVISPNPARDVIRVIMQSTANAGVICQVIDMKGTVLATQKASVATGRNEITIPASSLSKGMYVLKIIANNTTKTMRFVKE